MSKSSKTPKRAILEIGFQRYLFDSPAQASEAFKLLSNAVHVQRLVRIGKHDGLPEFRYETKSEPVELKVELIVGKVTTQEAA